MMKHSTLLSACLRAGICLVLLLSAHASHGQTVKTVSLKFDKNDFTFVKDSDGNLTIISDKLLSNYAGGKNTPALPYIHYYYLLQEGQSVKSIKRYNVDALSLLEGVTLSRAPENIPADMKEKAEMARKVTYSLKEYPLDNVMYTGTHNMGGFQVMSFCVCPFVYDAQQKKLTLYTSISIEISVSESKPNAFTKMKNSHSEADKEFVKDIIINPEELITYQSSELRDSSHPVYYYLVITSSSLASYFEPLIEWKKKKGLRSRIVTTSEIYNRYPNSSYSNQYKIKKFIKDFYDEVGSNEIYVLLGGCEYEVPTQKCHTLYNLNNGTYLEDNIPTDLYYSCLNGNLDWDGNGNGILGEINDNVSLYPSVCLTRIPVYYISDVQNYVDRIIKYESAPSIDSWDNSILMCGSQTYFTDTITGKSDSQIRSELIYNNHIYPFWNGTRYRFYDTFTDFSGIANYALNSNNLQYQLSQGYAFVDMISHGDQVLWRIEDGIYNNTTAAMLNNSQPTLISSVACNTNMFDRYPTLSGSFIGASNSNVIGYLGSSRESLTFSNNAGLSSTELFYAYYYDKLFKNYSYTSHYGRITSDTKSTFVSLCATDTAYRWSMFVVNAMGDPEMPVYTCTPKRFQNIKITYSNNSIIIEQNEHDVEMSAMSVEDNGDDYYSRCYVSGWSNTFTNLSDDVYISIQKHNYIPFIFRVKNGVIYIDDGTMLGNCTIKGAKVVIGSDIIPENPESNLRIDGKTIITNHNGVEINKNFEVPLGSELEIKAGN
jgi:hypothetical protein